MAQVHEADRGSRAATRARDGDSARYSAIRRSPRVAPPALPPPAVVRIDHQGDLKVDNMQTAGVSLHQGLSPSLWGSPAASRIPATTSSAPLTLSATAFMEGSVMEKKKDKMGLFNWVPRYMAISKPPSGGEGGHTGETPNILLWNLPPGTAAPGKPTDKQPDETILREEVQRRKAEMTRRTSLNNKKISKVRRDEKKEHREDNDPRVLLLVIGCLGS